MSETDIIEYGKHVRKIFNCTYSCKMKSQIKQKVE